MHIVEREIRKKYRYSNLSYVFDVYMECEYRANLTQEEYEGLQPGEFRFDYESWERRLGISKKQLVRAIKELTVNNAVIVQTFKGRKGISSKYFLTRFKEQKKEQNEELKGNSKGTETNLENTGFEDDGGTEKGTQKEQNEEQKKVHSSRYNNLDIISNKEKGTSIDKIINAYTGNLELRNTLKEFLKMRKSIKKPMTDQAMKLLINKLDKLGSNDNEKIEILNQSIFNSWQGIFELKNKVVENNKTIDISSYITK
ncbi:hypothetical protein H9660_08705 [Clostridium sp. Sa3CUN1]|uniref:Uncharacterized protein n=1 Tax=Clostridium gallinarum TaxID=2762246 RepID=A0ABR8Q480_9CLOT|nr:hypothetical protein [Clostridium gallinarum]MBD7915225.1 hypothetical protein [Clostridium gallinarum]